MGIFFVYILKASLCLAVYYLFYRLLLSKETFHRFNRIALLGLLVFSGVVPFVEVTMQEAPQVSQTFLSLEDMMLPVDEHLDVLDETPKRFPWNALAFLIYVLGILFFLVRHLWSLGRMIRLLRTSRKEIMEGGIILFVHKEKVAPFSWMKMIAVSEGDLAENGKAILTHERAHIHNRHSWDLLLAEACVFLQWFNPAAWLLKQELQTIHEYEADEWVIRNGIDAKTYQLLIIKKAVGARLYSIANSFNHSLTKKRITMMCKEKSKKWRCAKALYIVPVVAIAACSLSTQENNDADSVSKDNEFIVTNSFLLIDTARLNTAYRELMKRPSDKKCQEAFFDAFPANWDEFITTYGYFPQDGYDLTMYYLAYEHIKALGDCSASIDSVAYCRKLVNIAVGGIFQADAPNHFKSLLHRVMWERMDAMLDYISQLRRGYQMRFWQFYWSSIVPNKESEDEYARLYERNSREYPEEMNIMKIAFEYFHNGVNIHGSYIE